MVTERTRSQLTHTSPTLGQPARQRANPGPMFYVLPLSGSVLGGLMVGSFFFLTAVAAFLSDRAGYGVALSACGTAVSLLPVSIVWAALRWARERLEPGTTSKERTGRPTKSNRHWAAISVVIAANATVWLGIAVLSAGLPDFTLPGQSDPRTLLELLPTGLAGLGVALYAALAAIVMLVILVPVSAGPDREEPRRGLIAAVFSLFIGEVMAMIAAVAAKVSVALVLAPRIVEPPA